MSLLRRLLTSCDFVLWGKGAFTIHFHSRPSGGLCPSSRIASRISRFTRDRAVLSRITRFETLITYGRPVFVGYSFRLIQSLDAAGLDKIKR